MSIKLSFSRGSMKTEALLKDSAFSDLILLIQKHETVGDVAAPPAQDKPQKASDSALGDDRIGKVKNWLRSHTASEVLSRLGWDTFPDKILLLGAYYEARGGEEGWKSADLYEQFNVAKETFPKNFPRDIKACIDSGVVGTVTARSYKIGRTGWNKIGDGIDALSN